MNFSNRSISNLSIDVDRIKSQKNENAHARIRSTLTDSTDSFKWKPAFKHPEASPLHDVLLIQGPIKFLSPVIYDEITEDTILKAVSRTKGAGGVSCLDADEWRRILGSKIFGNVAIDLRKSLATLTKPIVFDRVN